MSQKPLPGDVLAPAVGLVDHLEVDAATHDGADDVEGFGWHVDRRAPDLTPGEGGQQARGVGAIACRHLRGDRRVCAQHRGHRHLGGVHLGDELIDLAQHQFGDVTDEGNNFGRHCRTEHGTSVPQHISVRKE